jgi:hypothetical protein
VKHIFNFFIRPALVVAVFVWAVMFVWAMLPTPANAQGPVSPLATPGGIVAEEPIPAEPEEQFEQPALNLSPLLDVLLGGELPNTAEGALIALAGLIISIFGLGNLTEVFTSALKKLEWKILGDEEKAKLSGLLAELVTFLVAAGVTKLLTLLTPFAQGFDAAGFWTVVLAVYGFARKTYKDRKAAVKSA